MDVKLPPPLIVLPKQELTALMPFGEYMPLGSTFPILKSFSPQTGDFQAGTEATPTS